jgi:TM2 domain-containing membrane protein YozV
MSTSNTRTRREVVADRVDTAMVVGFCGLFGIGAIGGLASLVVSQVVAGVITGGLSVVGLGILVLYVKTGFGCDE